MNAWEHLVSESNENDPDNSEYRGGHRAVQGLSLVIHTLSLFQTQHLIYNISHLRGESHYFQDIL